MRTPLTIGEFSRITHLSIKMLRRFHESGLLEPAEVDPHTGYRYYTADQVPTAQVIRRFRDLDMPVAELADVLATEDTQVRARMISAHIDRLEAQLDRTRSAVTALRTFLSPAPASVELTVRTAPALTVGAVRGTVDRSEVLHWYSDAMAELRRALVAQNLVPTGPPGGLYDNELFTEDRGEALVYVPVSGLAPTGRALQQVLPAVDLAVTVHAGPHDDIDLTYGTLGRWVSAHALAIAGPVRETYLVGPVDTPDSSRWRTEIGWPIFRTSGDPERA